MVTQRPERQKRIRDSRLEIAEMFGLTLGDQNSRLRLGVKYNRLGRKVERTYGVTTRAGPSSPHTLINLTAYRGKGVVKQTSKSSASGIAIDSYMLVSYLTIGQKELLGVQGTVVDIHV